MMQTRRKESQKESSYRNKRTTVLLGDPTLSIFPEIAARFIDGNRRLQIAGVSRKRCLTCDIYDRVRVHETEDRDRDAEDCEDDDIPQFRAGVVYIIPMARWYRKFYTAQREEEMRASSHAYVHTYVYTYPCAHVHSRLSSTTRGVVTLYRRDIEPWRSSSSQIRPEYLKEDGTYLSRARSCIAKIFTGAISM